jgi:hypothetical protein
MEVILSKERVDLQKCDILVIGLFQDERPLRGSSGWIDWRLNGRISDLLIKKKLTGVWKEIMLIPSQGRVKSRMILLLGLGGVRDYSYLRLREFSSFLLETLKKLNVSEMCLSFPYEENYNVDLGKLIEVLIEGIADTYDAYRDPLMKTWIKRIHLFFAEGEERFYETLLGVQTAKFVLKDRLKLKIVVPSDVNPGSHPSG